MIKGEWLREVKGGKKHGLRESREGYVGREGKVEIKGDEGKKIKEWK